MVRRAGERRAGPPGGELLEVELDDEDAAVRPSAVRPRGRRGGTRRARRRLSARAWSRVVVPLALVLAVGVGLDGASAADLAAPRDGLVADLRAPRLEHWRSQSSQLVGLVGDELLLMSADGASVEARAARDGTLRWSGPLRGCRLADPEAGATDPDSPRLAVLPADRARLLCVTAGAGGTSETVVAVAADGTVLATIPTPDEWGAFQSEGVVIVPGLLLGGRRQVSTYSLATGGPLWASSIATGDDAGIDVRDGVIVVGGATGLDLHTGAEVPAPTGPTAFDTARLPDGAVLRTRSADAGSTTEVVDPDGGVRWSAAGWPMLRPGSGDTTVVLVESDTGDRLAAHDVADGDVLWRTDHPLVPVAELEGVVVVVDLTDAHGDASGGTGSDSGIQLVGLASPTGDRLWSRSVGAGALWSSWTVTDGTRLAFPTADGVDVIDARTGALAARWQVPAGARPPAAGEAGQVGISYGSSSVVVAGIPTTLTPLPDGRLLLGRESEAVVLGW